MPQPEAPPEDKRAKLRNVRDDSDGWKMAIYDCAT